MLDNRVVQLHDSTLIANSEKKELYGGAVHYWRLDREKWETILQEVVNLGFTMISIYIPWEAHEISRGVFDFGQHDPRTDIDAFLTLCEAKGLNIIVRPGPQINSEMTWFGYPKRILEDERFIARNASGARSVLNQVPKPIPALSYAVDEFYDEVALWYDAICPILAKHAVNNGGGILACQVDNEMAFFFGINAYSGDFSDASLRLYREFLLNKYDSVEHIEQAYGLNRIENFDVFQPPRRFERNDGKSIAWYTDWAEYRETYLVDSMARLADMLRARGLDQIALFHNYPHPLGPGGAASGFTHPFNIPKLEEKLDFVGFDIYSRKHLYEHIKTVASYTVGSSRFPYIPEFIAGVWAWYLHPGDAADEEFVTKAAIMQGIKGFSRYMLVERDKWFFSPIRRDGTVRPMAHMHARMNEILKGVDFSNLRRQSDVLLLANREYDRLEAASVLVSFPGDFLETPSGFSEYPNRMTVSEDSFGFDVSPILEKNDYFAAFQYSLYGSGVGYLISDTDLDAGRWRSYPAIVLATEDWLDVMTQQDLAQYVHDGGTLVIGPKIPQLGHDQEPCTVLADELGLETGRSGQTTVKAVGSGHVILVDSIESARRIGDLVANTVSVTQSRRTDERIDVVVHEDHTESNRRIVFICNPTDEVIESNVGIQRRIVSAREIWDHRDLSLNDGDISARLEPYTIWICDCVVE
jgi:beta-galactosidase